MTGIAAQRLCLCCLLATAALLPAPVRAQPAGGKRYALLVGVKAYEHARLPDLEYTENDVTELARLLRPAGFEVTLLTDSRGKRDPDLRPTAKNVRAALKGLLAGKGKGDTVLVALAGHGLQMPIEQGGERKDESFFCPADAQVNDPQTLIGLRGLFSDLGECGAGLRLLLVDACRNKPKAGVRNLDVDSVPAASKGIAALFSCSAGEVAHETGALGKGHGVFFHCVLEALKGKARNRRGQVTWSGLAEYVTERVRAEVSVLSPGARQTPHEVKNLVGASPVLANASALLFQAPDFNLTGRWWCDDEGTYYVRQVGKTVWWLGKSKNDGQDWTNVLRGTIEDGQITGNWADVPQGRIMGSGTLTLELVIRGGEVVGIRKQRQVGDHFGGRTWTRAE